MQPAWQVKYLICLILNKQNASFVLPPISIKIFGKKWPQDVDDALPR